VYSREFANFQKQNFGIFLAAAILSVIIVIVLSCFTKYARTVPTNYILLFIFTICEAYMVSTACARVNNPKIVLMAACMTCGIVLALTIYAWVTDTDFTVYGGILFCLSIALLFFSIFALFTSNKMIHTIISCLAVLLFSIYLIYDTQLVLGRQQYSLSVDDYIIGAMIIYTDIIVIFLELLSLLSR
jgi:FtsH-binding integral membrane protein